MKRKPRKPLLEQRRDAEAASAKRVKGTINPTQEREVCATSEGYREHRRNQEVACKPCRAAWAERARHYRNGTGPFADD